MTLSPAHPPDRARAETVANLRRRLSGLESFASDAKTFAFGVPGLDSCLPQGGLAFGVLHEIAPEADDDTPAAFGFAAALAGRMAQTGSVLLVTTPKFARSGRPYGHGLNRLGLDPGRLILVEAQNDIEALWAMEEALRSGAPAAVLGSIGIGLDLTMSRRLHLAAEHSKLPFLLMRPADASGASAAATRWRIGAAKAARDRFGLLERWRWAVRLERCRNGRTGGWLVEFDHAYRFNLAAPLADPALSDGAGPQPLTARAGRP